MSKQARLLRKSYRRTVSKIARRASNWKLGERVKLAWRILTDPRRVF